MVFDPLDPLRRDLNRIGRALGISKTRVMEVSTDARLFYTYLTEKEVEFRESHHPPRLSDVTALGSHYGKFEISESELATLVKQTPRVSKPAHHKVWIGQWELGMSWDRLLVYAKEK